MSRTPLMANTPRSWRRLVCLGAAVLVVACFVGWLVVGHVARTRLVAEARRQLGADLRTGFVWYRPPLGLRARNVRLSVPDSQGRPVEVLTAKSLAVDLGAVPRKGRPPQIEWLSATDPVVRLVRTDRGWLFRGPGARPPSRAGPAARRQELTEALQVRHLRITGGKVLYEDRTRPGATPITWPNINVAMDADGGAAAGAAATAQARYSLSAGTNGALWLRSRGTADPGHLTIEVQELALGADAAAAARELPLPEPLARKLHAYAVAGRVELNGGGSLRLDDPAHSTLKASLEVRDASASLPRCPLDRVSARLAIQTTTPADVPTLTASIDRADASSGRATLHVEGGTFAADRQGWALGRLLATLDVPGEPDGTDRGTGAGTQAAGGPTSRPFLVASGLRGRVRFTAAAAGPYTLPPGRQVLETLHPEVLAYPRDVAFRVPTFPAPIEHVGGGSVELRGGAIEFKHLHGAYGPDELLLDGARLVLEDPKQHLPLEHLRQQVRFDDIVGAVLFKEPAPPYPSALQAVMAQLRPTGPFSVGGWYAINRRGPDDPLKLKPDYFLRLMSDGGAFAVLDRRVPLTHLRGQANFSPMTIDLSRSTAACLGGTVEAAGTITPDQPTRYTGTATLSELDVAEIGRAFHLPQPKHGKLEGHASARATVAGSGPEAGRTALQNLHADGEFEAWGGDFFGLPVLGQVVEKAHKGDPLTVGEAAGFFTLADRTVELRDFVISSPALGLQGSGTVGFDKKLDLRLTLAPLGDWRDRMRQARIPLVSDVAGEVLGAMQKLFNAAQDVAINAIEVTGTTNAPVVTDLPVPALSDPLKLLFGRMLAPPTKGRRLIDVVREQQATRAGQREAPRAPRAGRAATATPSRP